MKISTYNDIVSSIKHYNGLSIKCAKYLIKTYSDISPNTLYSILANISIYNKNCIYFVSAAKSYANLYRTNSKERTITGNIIKVSEQKRLPPALFMKQILEEFYNDKDVSQKYINNIIKDTTMLQDKFLALDIFLCTLYDFNYGPISVSIAHSIGQEYEIKLQNYMLEHNIAFVDEEHLKSRGYDKTPDIKLEVPIAVDGMVINWIESKALFGSVALHKRYMNKQYCSYWNRFGPGLIIYWFDFIDTLNHLDEKRFIIMNHLPKNITHLTPNDTKISFV